MRIRDLAERAESSLERRASLYLCGFSIVYFANTVLRAARRPLWLDEFYTLYLSRLPSVGQLWQALNEGADQNPPLYYLLTRATHLLLGEGNVATRLPAMIGFWIMSLCLFQFVRKRTGALYALVAMLIPLVTDASSYAFEARAYGFVLGCCGAALLCWQAAAEGTNRRIALAGLTVSLTAALGSHCYALLLLPPLVVGELVRSYHRRRLDWPMLGALGAALPTTLLYIPLIAGYQPMLANTWAKPRWTDLVHSYEHVLGLGVLPLLAAAALLLILPATLSAVTEGRPKAPVPPLHEVVAAASLVALPILAVLLAKFVTGVFADRYTLPLVVGLAILGGFVAHRSSARAEAGLALTILLAGWWLAANITRHVGEPLERVDVEGVQRAGRFGGSGNEALPIAVSSLENFVQFSYYAPPAVASRLFYLGDPQAAASITGMDTGDRGILRLRQWAPLQVEEYASFVAAHPRFLVYDERRQAGWNWLVDKLAADGARLELKESNNQSFLFEVQGPRLPRQ